MDALHMVWTPYRFLTGRYGGIAAVASGVMVAQLLTLGIGVYNRIETKFTDHDPAHCGCELRF